MSRARFRAFAEYSMKLIDKLNEMERKGETETEEYRRVDREYESVLLAIARVSDDVSEEERRRHSLDAFFAFSSWLGDMEGEG